MRRFIAAMLVVCGAWGVTAAAWAEDLAVILANEYYRNHPRVQDTGAILNLDGDFRRAGFAVVQLHNTESNFDDAAADQLLQRISRARRLVVVISGHIVRSNDDGWLLHSDAGRVNALSVGRQALPIRTFLAFAAAKQGEAVVAIASRDQGLTLGTGVKVGYRPQRIGQGVTVLTGSQRQISGFIANNLLVPGRTFGQALRNAPDGFRAAGYLPPSRAFLPGFDNGPVGNPLALENAVWQQARAANTIRAYEDFLGSFPNGQYAAEARQRLNELRLTPQDRARIAEEALRLTRDQRRSIQRNLTLLGFDTAGVDGILGNRSRHAIGKWQASVGVFQTGYLNANQISRLQVDAATRAEQLRREAERRRQEQERRDRNYWQQTGASGTEAGYHAYLHRYPDGLYSDQATEALREIERQQRREAEAEERRAWDEAVMAGTVQSYKRYLNAYPQGRFAEEARARINSLSNPETPPNVVAAAKAEENRLNLNQVTRNLIELQLRKANLDPGRVDGKFTKETRRALRKYQRANSLDVTGYVTKATIVRLLADAVN